MFPTPSRYDQAKCANVKMMMETNSALKEIRTKIAVLGTLAEFHQEPIPYNLATLVDLVQQINPDLLCLDLTLAQWQAQDFSGLPPEYGQALLPLAYQTDVVVVPIGGKHPMPRAQAGGWRGWSIQQLRQWIALVQRNAPGPDAINQGWRHEVANFFYDIARRLAQNNVQQAYQQHIDHLTAAVLDVARRDPASRILVVVNVQYCHHIRAHLRQDSSLEVTSYHTL